MKSKVSDIIEKAKTGLAGANLSKADLRFVNLAEANLTGVDLSRADLTGANLFGTNLTKATLFHANLTEANLIGANLFGSCLDEANFRDAKGLDMFKIVPEEGSFIGWKKAHFTDEYRHLEVILKLEIPTNAKRVNAYGSRKCRASSARVLAIYRMDGKPFRGKGRITGTNYSDLEYARGKLMRANAFDPDPRVECSYGIHFFLTRQEAIDWV